MPSCREVDALVTPYVDGEASVAERRVVEAHLQECPGCRKHAEVEQATRAALRSCLQAPCAPAFLRARCRAAAGAGRLTDTSAAGTGRRSLAAWAMAAALVFFTGGLVVYGLTRLSPTVLAAQLALDHVKCFAVHRDTEPVDARSAEAQFARENGGWQVHLPDTSVTGLRLVGMRRCFCAEGAAAHVMYRLAGRPVSLYVLPEVNRTRASVEAFGHDAIIWSNRGTTYVLLGQEPDADLERLAADLNHGL